MTIFKNKTIRAKLFLLFFLISIVPLAIVGVASYNSFKQTTDREIEAKLDVSTYAKKAEIEDYLNGSKLDAEVISQTADIRNAVDRLVLYHKEMEIKPDGNYDISSVKTVTKKKVQVDGEASGTDEIITENVVLTETYENIWKSINGFLKTYIEKYDYDDIYLICEKHGHVMYSAKKSADLGENIGVGQFKDGVLAEAWNEAKKGNVYITDIKPCDSQNGAPAIFVAAPIYKDGEIVSVVVLRLSQTYIDKIMKTSIGMGETGNSYLVGADGYFRSNSRLIKESTLLKTKVDNIGFKTVLTTKKDFDGAYGNFESEASAKARNADYSKSLGGVPVLGMNIYLPDYNWVLMTEMDQSEALSGVRGMRNTIIVIIFFIFIGAVLILFYFSRSINSILNTSISQMISSANSLSATAQQNSAASQQTSSISQQVASGAASQSKQAEEVSKAISSMASSVQQMSASAQEAASTAEKSSNMAQTAGQAGEKSRTSLENIKKIVSNTAVMARGMSSKSREIGDIVETITSIAQQTNLLALNANIEAARAGEAGRGFAVVADEVRKLAEGSGEAADRIKSLITDMMASVEETANAAEAGTVTVEESSQVINETIGSLQNISTSVLQVSSKIQELSAGIQQQAASTQQIARNMDSIAAISEQNSAGAQQLSATTQQQSSANQQVAAAAQQLQALSSDLMSLVKAVDEVAKGNIVKMKNGEGVDSKSKNKRATKEDDGQEDETDENNQA